MRTISFSVSQFLFLLLFAVSVNSAEMREPSPDETPIKQARLYEKQRNFQQAADMYLITSRKMTPPHGEPWRVKAAELAWMGGNTAQAERIIRGTDEAALNPTMLARQRVLLARIARYNQNFPGVLRVLEIPTGNIPNRTRKQLETLRAEAQRKTAAARQKPTLRAQSRPTQDYRASDDNSLWQSLLSLPLADLQQRMNAARTPLQKGWTELAYISQATTSASRANALANWNARYPGHPATQGYLQQVETYESDAIGSVNRIAVMLPLTGKLANLAGVISEGINSATRQNTSGSVPDIQFYDSANQNAAGISTLYNQIVAEGADIVIGPMSKQLVDSLTQAQLSVPVVTLNYGNRVDLYNPQLFQFALLPEDEAHAAADKISTDGHRTVGVLTPSTSWGKRLSEAFSQKAQTLGLEIVTAGAFDPDSKNSSSIIKSAFEVQETEAKKQVDAIFLAATPRQARLIKPLLKFHFLGHVPVYATSHVYTGDNNGTSDSDLNGIAFTEIPWLLETGNPDFPSLDSLGDVAKHYPRMFAFGYDAAKLAMQVSATGSTPQVALKGLSGNLYPDSRNRIHRLVGWAKFQRGFPQPVLIPGVPQ